MSNSIDSKVVEMRFDNSHFEKNVQTSLSTIEKLKQKLNFKGVDKSFDGISKAAKKVDMAQLGASVDKVGLKFNGLYTVADQALRNITNSAMAAGKNIVKALTIDPIKSGFQEYELKMDSIKTIIASTGESVQTVNKYLNELNEYSDQTIYSFSDMTQNIGKFTNAGVKLEDAVMAIKGISNEAAVSGANANEASRAMYNFAQALSAGYVKLIDWKSIENANMATVEFKNQLIESALAAGTLKKASNGMYKTLKGNTLSATKDFNETLQDQWMTTEVLVNTLKDYADNTTEIGKKAFAAAQDVTKFTQVFDILKETAQSGWARTWEILIGDIEQAKAIFTPLTNFFSDIINGMSDFRNNLLEGAMSSPLGQLAKKIANVTAPVTEATDKLKDFGKVVNDVLYGNYGNGQSRFDKLAQEGYDWAHIQNLVNEKLGDSTRHATTFSESQKEVTEAVLALTDAELKNLGLTEQEIELYRELEVQAKASGKSVNELIAEMDQLDGRTMLVESFKNIGQGLVKTFGAIKDAWVNIFPPMTSEQLYNIIAGFHEFSQSLAMGDETAGKLQKTFEGLFAALDIILTIVGGPIKIAFNLLTDILSGMGVGILDVTAYIGDMIVKFRNWIDSILDFETVFEPITDAIKTVVDSIKEFFNSMKNDETAAENFKKICEGLEAVLRRLSLVLSKSLLASLKVFGAVLDLFGTDMATVLGVIGDYIKKAMDWVNTHLLIANSIDEVAKIFHTLIEGVQKCIKSFLGLPAVQKIIENFKNTFGSFLGGLADGLNGFSITSFCDRIREAFESLNSWIQSLKDSENIGRDIIAGLVNGLTAGISNVISVVTDIATKIISTIKSIFVIQSPSQVMIAIGKFIIAGLILGLTAKATGAYDAIANICSNLYSKLKDGFGKALDWVKNIDMPEINWGVVLGIASLIGAVVVVKKGLDIVDKFGEGVKGFGKMCSGAGKLMDAFANKINPQGPSKFESFADTALKISAAVAILAGSIYVLSQLDIKTMWSAVGAVTVLMGVLIGLTAVAGNVDMSKNGGFGKLALLVVSLAASMLIMSKAVEQMAGLEWSGIGKGLAAIGGLVLLVTLFTTALGNTASSGVIKAAGTLLALSLAIGILVGVMALIGKLSPETIEKGLGVIAGLMLFLGLFVAGISMYGGQVVKVGGTLLALSLAIGILVGVMALIGKLSPETIAKGATVIGGLMIFLGLFVAGLSPFSGQIAKVGGTLLALSLAIGILVGVMALIGKLSPETIGKGALVIGGLMTFLGLFIQGISMVGKDVPKVAGTLLALSAAIAILAVVMTIMGMLSPEHIAKGLAVVVGLGLIMTAMIKATRGASDCKDNLIKMTVAIGVMAAAVAALSFIDGSKLAGATAAMGILMGIFTAMIYVAGTAQASMGPLIVMTVAVGLIAGVLYLIAQLPVENALASALGLSALLLAMSAAMLVLDTIKSVSARAVGALVIMTIVVGVLGEIIMKMQGLNPEQALSTVVSISALLLSMSAVLGVLTVIGLGGWAALIGIGSLVALIAAMVGVFAAMGKLAKYAENLDKGIEMVNKVASGIGSMIGNFVSGFATAAMSGLPEIGAQLSAFMTAAMPFIIGAKLIDESAVNGVKSLVEAILMITGANLLESITSWLTGGSSLESFGSQLGSLGGYLNEFVSSLGTFDESTVTTVTCASNAIKALAEAAGSLPNEGGWLGAIVGENDIGAFTEKLPAIGSALASFKASLGDFSEEDCETISSGAKAIGLMAEAAESIPNEGGWLGAIVGNNDVGAFAEKLPAIGSALASFKTSLGDFTEEDCVAVESGAKAIGLIANAAESIPNEGGWLGKIVGDNDIGTFAEKLPDIGSAIKEFADSVGSGIDAKINNAVKALNAITALGKLDLSSFGDNIENVGEELNDFADELYDFTEVMDSISSDTITNAVGKIQDMVSSISSLTVDTASVQALSDSLKTLASTAISGFTQAFNDKSSDVSSAVKSMVSNAAATIKDNGSQFSEAGTTLMEEFADAISSSTAGSDAAGDMASSAAEKADSASEDFKTAGKNAADGFAAGIKSGTTAVGQAVQTLVNVAVSKMNSLLDINSPSKVFMGIGGSVVEGFAKGITKNTKMSNKAIVAMGDASLEAFKDFFGIHSPALEMTEQGHYIVQGLADGITEDMSAEEAITKKAENIITAYSNAIDVANSKMTSKYAELSLADTVNKIYGSYGDPGDDFIRDNSDSQALMLLGGTLRSDVHQIAVEKEKLAKGMYEDLAELLGEDDVRTQEAYTAYINAAKERAEAWYYGYDYGVWEGLQTAKSSASEPYIKKSEELGRYIVENIAYGIESDMTAEEQAEKKAQNIIDAFQKEFDKSSVLSDIASKEFELWSITEGRTATKWEIDTKTTERMSKELNHAWNDEILAYSKWQEMVSQFGEDSEKANEAYSEYYDARIRTVTANNSLSDYVFTMLNNEMEEYETAMETRQKIYDKWLKTDGKSATEQEKYDKTTSLLYSDLHNLNSKLRVANQLHEEAILRYGADSQEVLDAWNTCIDIETEIADKTNEIIDHEIDAYEKYIEAVGDSRERLSSKNQLYDAKFEYSVNEHGKVIKDLRYFKQDLKLLNDQLNTEKEKYDYIVSKYGKNSEEAKESLEKITQYEIDIANCENSIIESYDKICEITKKKYETLSSIEDLEYQLWEKTAGKNATSAEKDAAKVLTVSEKLRNESNLMLQYRDEWTNACKRYGQSSNEANEAYQNYLQKQVDIADLQNEIIEINDKAVARQKASQSEYSDYMKKYKKFYLMNGMTEEDLERDAKLVSGYDPTNTLNSVLDKATAAFDNITSDSRYNELLSNFSSMGTSYISAITDGVDMGTDTFFEETLTIVKSCVDKVKSKAELWEEAGKSLVDGLITGIQESMNEAVSVAVKLGNAVSSALQNGDSSDLSGSNKLVYVSNNGALLVTGVGLESVVTETLAKSASDSLNDNSNGGVQTVNNNTTNNKTVNYVQNNYSPKSLNTTEVYRNTKNQLSGVKGDLA